MTSNPPLTRGQSARVRLAAAWMGLLSVGYAGLSAAYFHADFFSHMSPCSPLMLDSNGLATHLGGDTWTVLSFLRLVGAGLSVLLLGLSARNLWRQAPRARVGAVVTLWGLLLPQTLWYTEYLADWHEGRGILTALAAGLGVVAVPTALLFGRRLVRQFEGRDVLTGWATLSYGRGRLVAAAVVMAWLAFAGAAFIDHSIRLPSALAWSGALMAALLGGAATWGILRLRAWALWLGVGAALALALVPLSALWTPYLPNAGWQIDLAVATLARTEAQRALWAVFPLSAVWLIAGPFLRDFLRKLRD
jgi:hypothetical protein